MIDRRRTVHFDVFLFCFVSIFFFFFFLFFFFFFFFFVLLVFFPNFKALDYHDGQRTAPRNPGRAYNVGPPLILHCGCTACVPW